jgi:hypothetical protein
MKTEQHSPVKSEYQFSNLIDEGRQQQKKNFQGYVVCVCMSFRRPERKWKVKYKTWENWIWELPSNIFLSHFPYAWVLLELKKKGKMSRKEEKKARKNFIKPWGTFQPITNMAAAALLRVF